MGRFGNHGVWKFLLLELYYACVEKLNGSCIAILQGRKGDAQAIGHRHLGGCYGRLSPADFRFLIVHAEWACPIMLTSADSAQL
jgi:hypothetical protein